MPRLTNELELEYGRKALAAFQAKNFEEHKKYMKLIPVEPSMAKIIKKVRGVKAIEEKIAEGYDFSRVEEEYGKDWLYK